MHLWLIGEYNLLNIYEWGFQYYVYVEPSCVDFQLYIMCSHGFFISCRNMNMLTLLKGLG